MLNASVQVTYHHSPKVQRQRCYTLRKQQYYACIVAEQQGPQPLERPFVLKSCVPRDPQLGLRTRARSLSSCTDYHHLMSNPLLNEHCPSSFLFLISLLFTFHLPLRRSLSLNSLQPSINERMSAAVDLLLHHRVVHLDGGAHAGRDVHALPVDAPWHQGGGWS